METAESAARISRRRAAVLTEQWESRQQSRSRSRNRGRNKNRSSQDCSRPHGRPSLQAQVQARATAGSLSLTTTISTYGRPFLENQVLARGRLQQIPTHMLREADLFDLDYESGSDGDAGADEASVYDIEPSPPLVT